MTGFERSETQIYGEVKEKLDITRFDLVTEGLSDDKKFHIETIDGKQFLLRVSNILEYERKNHI